MINILLVCAGGFSTSLLVNKMMAAAKEMNIEVHIEAVGAMSGGDKAKGFDMVLLGPQIRFHKEGITKAVEGKIPVEVIDMRLYGTMNGKAVLNHALEVIQVWQNQKEKLL